MAEFGDESFVDVGGAADPFGGAAPSDSTRAPLDEAAWGVDQGEPDVSQPVIQLSSQESQAAFIGGYTPQPVADPFSATPATPRVPAAEDPRVLLNRKQQELLAKKEKEEAANKKAAGERAKAHISKFDADRAKQLATRKKANRDAETASPESGVPKGATWEKVNLLINFNHDKAHTKDLSRFKECLQTCKTLNVAISAK